MESPPPRQHYVGTIMLLIWRIGKHTMSSMSVPDCRWGGGADAELSSRVLLLLPNNAPQNTISSPNYHPSLLPPGRQAKGEGTNILVSLVAYLVRRMREGANGVTLGVRWQTETADQHIITASVTNLLCILRFISHLRLNTPYIYKGRVLSGSGIRHTIITCLFT